MSNLPTKTMIMEWVKNKKYKALEQFDTAKKAEILKSLFGTDTEDKAKEWDECVAKMQRLYDEMQEGNSWKKGLCYSTGEYLRNVLNRLTKQQFEEEKRQ